MIATFWFIVRRQEITQRMCMFALTDDSINQTQFQYKLEQKFKKELKHLIFRYGSFLILEHLCYLTAAIFVMITIAK